MLMLVNLLTLHYIKEEYLPLHNKVGENLKVKEEKVKEEKDIQES
jgi:hypothetical protein